MGRCGYGVAVTGQLEAIAPAHLEVAQAPPQLEQQRVGEVRHAQPGELRELRQALQAKLPKGIGEPQVHLQAAEVLEGREQRGAGRGAGT